MPPSPTHLINDIDPTNAASYTTASFSIAANRLVLVAVTGSIIGAGVNTPTLTGLSATWVLVAEIKAGTDEFGVFVFRTMVSSNQTGTLAINFGGQTQLKSSWAVTEWSGVDTSGTNGSGAIVQSATNTNSGVTSLAVTLVAYASVANRPYAALRINNQGNFTAESGWTEFFNETGEDDMNHTAIWRDDTTDTTPSVSWPASARVLGVAVEIRASGQAARAMHHYRMMRR